MSQEIFFVDAALPGADAVKSGLELTLGEGSKVFMINENESFDKIFNAIKQNVELGSLDAIHLYAPGGEGKFTLGGHTVINETALGDANTAGILAQIKAYLKNSGEVLLYAAEVAKDSNPANPTGTEFVNLLASKFYGYAQASSDENIYTLNYKKAPDEKKNTVSSVTPYGAGHGDKPDTDAAAEQWGSLTGEDRTHSETLKGSVTNDKLYAIKKDDGISDVLAGGDGHDVYYIENKNAVVLEDDNEGNDTLVSRVADFDLSKSDFPGDFTQVEHIELESVEGMGEEQSFTGNAVAQTIKGNALNNKLVGMYGADSLDGGDGDDSLDGGDGNLGAVGTSEADTMVGGKGNDTYVVRSANQVVTEKAKEGTDEVFSFIDYTLGANVENLTLLAGAVKGTGNADANVLKGNNLSNYLSGLGGNDTLHGGKVTLGDGGGVTYVDAFGTAVLNKNAVAGEAVNRDIDTLDGGAGNDTYYVYRDVLRDSVTGNIAQGDVIVDSAGKDTIISSVNYNLKDAAQVEELQLVGTATKGYGNSLNNRIVGNETLGSILDGTAGNNTLVGGYGNDTFIMRSTGDKIEDLGGNDTVESFVTVNLASSKAAIENILLQDVVDPAVLAKNKNANNTNATAGKSVATVLVGNSGNNQLTGGDKNDVLYGGATGKDTLTGGKGDDLYVVTSANVTVKEGATDAADSVVASVDYALGAKSNVERLYLAKKGTQIARQGTGNELANVIAVATDVTAANAGLAVIADADVDADNKLVLDGGKNTAGLAGDTLIGHAKGYTQFYTYNANDSIEAQGDGNVVIISYDVTGAVGNAQTASAATDADWVAYFNARGVTFENDPTKVSFVYRGNPAAKKATDDGIDIQAKATQTYVVGTNAKDTLKAYTNVDPAQEVATTIDGGKGADSMIGASKDDTFYVDDVKDSVDGKVGKDKVFSSVSVNLRGTADALPAAVKSKFADKTTNTAIDNVEVVELTGTGAVNAAGNASSATTLIGNAKNNVLVGGSVADRLDGGEGADSMYGGAGDNVFVVDNTGDRVFTNGIATDSNTIEVKGVNLKLSDVKAYNEKAKYTYSVKTLKHAAGDTTALKLSGTDGREKIDASGSGILAGAAGDTIDGNGGEIAGTDPEDRGDTIIGSAGNDLIYYYGKESIDGNGGMDTLYVRGGLHLKVEGDGSAPIDDTVLSTFAAVVADKDWGPDGNVSVDYSALTNVQRAAMGINTLISTQGISITGNAYNMAFTGSDFDDYIATGGGTDTVDAGDGNDTIELVTSSSAKAYSAGTVDGGEGEDTLILGSGADKLVLSDGATTGVVVINTATAIKNGKTTLDTKVTATSIEEISGGAGNDVIDATLTKNGVTLSGGAGTNTLYGGAGSDTFVLRDGTDTIWTDGNPKGTDGKGAGYDNSVVSHDVIKLTAQAAGKTFTVKDFNAGLDAVDWDALKALGWKMDTPTQSGTTATLTLSDPANAKNKITVKFENTVGKDIKFESTTEVDASQSFADNTAKVNLLLTADALKVAATRFADRVTVAEGKTATAVYGNGGDDSLTGEGVLYGGSGNDSMVGNGELYGDGYDALNKDDMSALTAATAGNDTLVATALAGTTKFYTGDGDNVVRIEGVAAEQSANTAIITGGDGTNDTLVLASAAALNLSSAEIAAGTIDEALVGKDGEQSKALAANSIAMAGNAVKLTMTKMDSISGSAGADYIVAGAEALKYTTGGGADTVIGSALADSVTVTTLVDGANIDLKAGANTLTIEAVTAGPAASEAKGVALKADSGSLNLVFGDAVELDMSEGGKLTMGKQTLNKIEIANMGSLTGSAGADKITAGSAALNYTTGGGADSVTGSSLGDTITVTTLADKLVIDGKGGADSIKVNAIAGKGAVTINSNGDADHPGAATLDFGSVEGSNLTLTLGAKNSVALNKDTVTLNGLNGVTTFKGSDSVIANHFLVDTLKAGTALMGGSGTGVKENTFQVANFEKDAAVTISGGSGANNVLIFKNDRAVKLDLEAGKVSLDENYSMSLANVENINQYVGTKQADTVIGKQNVALTYATSGGADSVTASGAANDNIYIVSLEDGMSIDVANSGTSDHDNITIRDVKTFTATSAKPTVIKSGDGEAYLVFDDQVKGGVELSLCDVEGDSTSRTAIITRGGKTATNVTLTNINHFQGTGYADTVTVQTLTDGLDINVAGAYYGDNASDLVRIHSVAAGEEPKHVVLTSHYEPEDPARGGKLSIDNDSLAAAMTLTGGEDSRIQIGGNATSAYIGGFTYFKGTAKADTITATSLQNGWTLDGGTGGADTITINGLAADSVTATIKSGGIGGTLSFADAASENNVAVTLGANGKSATATKNSRTAELTLDRIGTFVGTKNDDTFNVAALTGGAYTLDGGAGADIVSFAKEGATAGVAATLAGGSDGTSLTANGATLTLTGIEKIQGTAKDDTFKVGKLLTSGSYALAGNGGDDTVSFEDAELSSAGVGVSLTGNALKYGGAILTLDGVTTVKGTAKEDTFTLDSVTPGMSLNGGAGGADVFNVKQLVNAGATDGTFSVSSGAAGGTLNFAEMTADVSEGWTLDSAAFTLAADSVTVNATSTKSEVEDKTTTNTVGISNIGAIAGSATKANTFKVGTLASGAYSLTGGTATDTVSFADKTGDDGVTATLEGSKLTVTSGPVLTLAGIESIQGTAKADTFTLGRETMTISGNGGKDTVVFNYKDGAETPANAGIVVDYTGAGERAVSLVKNEATYADAIAALNRSTAAGAGLKGTVTSGKVEAAAATLTDIAVVNTAQTDVFNIKSKAAVSVDGGAGADIYNIDLRGVEDTTGSVNVTDASTGNQINLFGIDITSATADAFIGTLTFTWAADQTTGMTTLSLASSDTTFTGKANVLTFTGKTDSFAGNMLTFWDGAENLGNSTLLASIDLGSLVSNGTSGSKLAVGTDPGQAQLVAESPIAEYKINPAA